jgi:hypothetical protein
MREMSNTYKILVRNRSINTNLDESIILNWTLKKSSVWTGFIWLRQWLNEHVNAREIFGSHGSDYEVYCLE